MKHVLQRFTTSGKRALSLGAGCLAAFLLSAHGPASAQATDDAPDRAGQQFALPLARDALTLAERVVEHIAGERREEALADLQNLFERHATELLPAEWRLNPERKSQFPTYPGAAVWALNTLAALPENWKARYVERYEASAQVAYKRARTAHNRQVLASVTRRWPLCPSAEDSAWTLGDLELESGHLDSARNAWERAERLALAAGRVPRYDRERRVRRATEWLGEDYRTSAALTDRGLGGPIPKVRTTSWSTNVLDFGLVTRGGYAFNAYPVVFEDTLLATNSLQVVALDSSTGSVRWLSGGPRGWDRVNASRLGLFDGINPDHLLIAPAVGGGVVVAALQLPISVDPEARYHGIDITTPVPERRLFAFDLETGEELWNHAPPYTWNAKRDSQGAFSWRAWEGDYTERMMISAPPTVAGSRVIVPCHLQAGRINFHLACYQLETGELLWNTSLISGQRPRNMFGRISEEFAGTPVTVVGDQVIVQTELGTIASVDLISGQIQWQSQYDTIQLNRAINYDPARRSYAWRERPPIVVNDEIIVATPSDSEDLIGLDLEDGRVLWSYNDNLLERQVDYLVGADKDSVYLAGPNKLVRLEKRGGLRAKDRFRRAWSTQASAGRDEPRPILTADAVIVPGDSSEERRVFDRATGNPKSRLSAAWPDDTAGNLWLGEGVLFSLSQSHVSAFFDRELLLQRRSKARELDPTNPALIVAEADLLLNWGKSLYEVDGEHQQSLEHLREAEELYEQLRGDDLRSARTSRYELERTRARLHQELGAVATSVRHLERALSFAPTRSDRTDTLLALEQHAATEGQADERLRLLGLLVKLADRQSVPTWRMEGAQDWFFSDSQLDHKEWSDIFGFNFPLGAYIALSRAETFAQLGDTVGALDVLHDALTNHGELFLGDDPGGAERRLNQVLIARISRRIEVGGRASYSTFEARAAALFDEAHADRSKLEAVVKRFPLANAADKARAQLVDLAFTNADPIYAVQAVFSSPATSDLASEQGAVLLARLADVFGRRGNREFQAGLLASLAKDFPTLTGPGAEAQSLSDLAMSAALPAPTPPAVPTFDDRAQSLPLLPNSPDPIGRLLSQTDGEPALRIILQRGELLAFSEDDPAQAAWALTVSSSIKPHHVTLAEDRVILGTNQYIEAYDISGRPVWRQDLEVDRLHRVIANQGVVVVHARSRQSYHMLLAFDARQGIPLWSTVLSGRASWQEPMFGTGVMLLPSQPIGTPDRMAVIDLFRGVERARYTLPKGAPPGIEDAAWCRGRQLFVPDFFASGGQPSGVTVLDIDTGERIWSADFPLSEELQGTLHLNGEDYLVTTLAEAGSGKGTSAIYRLDRRKRRAARVIGLDSGAHVIGLDQRKRSILERPFVFIQQPSRGDKTSVVAWNLETGRRLWTRKIPASELDLQRAHLPYPVTSETTVALVYQTTEGSRSNTTVTLEFLDLNTGLMRDRRQLRPELSRRRQTLELQGIGSALFLFGRNSSIREGCLEILETPR